MKLASLINLKPLKEGSMQARELADYNSLEELQAMYDQLMRDMEQEAEPEGGPIADQYADEIQAVEDAIRIKKDTLYPRKKKPMPYDVAVGKITQDEYDKIMSTVKSDRASFEKSSKFDRVKENTPDNQLADKILSDAMKVLADDDYFDNDYPGGDIAANGSPYLQFDTEDQAEQAFNILQDDGIDGVLVGDMINLTKAMTPYLDEDKENKPMSDEELEDLETRADDYFSEPIKENNKIDKFNLKKYLQEGKLKENTAYLDGQEVDYSNIDLYSDIDKSWSSLDIMEEDLLDWFKASVASMGKEGGEEIIQSIRSLNNAMVQHLRTLNEYGDDKKDRLN